MRVLGIDPGIERTGIAVVDGHPGDLHLIHSGLLSTVPQDSDARRLASLHAQVSEVVDDARPDVAAIEQLFFSVNRQTAMRVAEARGTILAALGAASVRAVAEYTPGQVKEAVAGYGSAGKAQVARMVSLLLRVAVAGTDDVADACAIAVCHHHRAVLASFAGAAGTSLDEAVVRARARQART